MRIDVFTLFPEAFDWFSGQIHVDRARSRGVALGIWNYRDYTPLAHGQVDNTPYGGGAGMVLRIDVIAAALEAVFGEDAARVKQSRRVVELTPRGRQLDDRLCDELAAGEFVVLCGRYEGINERVTHLVSDRVSIGPYVLAGGEIAAMAMLDAVVRKIEGAVSNPQSVVGDSFSRGLGGALEHPHYTRPASFRGWEAPAVLLTGNHAEIARWRAEQLGAGGD